MERLTREELEAQRDDFDRTALATPGIDSFCSSTPWILAAGDDLTPARRPWLWRGRHGYVALASARSAGARLLRPLETMWCFACPLLGPDPDALAAEFAEHIHAREQDWRRILLSGIPLPGSPLFDALLPRLAHYRLFEAGRCLRYRACLFGGAAGFLSRRSRRLRQSLRRARRAAATLGITFESPTAPPEILFARLLDVERRSWKGRSGFGVDHGRMRRFYEAMLPRLLETHRLRLIFARHEDRDAGYCLGGVLGPIYRGLQFSFDDAYREVGLGNLLQLEQIERLEHEPVELYDLGAQAPYKARWAEQRLETIELLIER